MTAKAMNALGRDTCRAKVDPVTNAAATSKAAAGHWRSTATATAGNSLATTAVQSTSSSPHSDRWIQRSTAPEDCGLISPDCSNGFTSGSAYQNAIPLHKSSSNTPVGPRWVTGMPPQQGAASRLDATANHTTMAP